MNHRLMVCSLVVGYSTRLALGDPLIEPDRQHVDLPGEFEPQLRIPERRWGGGGGGGSISVFADEAWLSKKSKDLLDIIEILYKGRDPEIKELEAAQAKMKSADQIERRITLIKDTLSKKADEVWLPSVFADEAWLSKKSKDLLDIIEILYKGRDPEIKELEAAQAKMKSADQIERRIDLIKATLSQIQATPSQ